MKWIFSTRNQPLFADLFQHSYTLWDFGALPALSTNDIRTILIQQLDQYRYELFKRDTSLEDGSYHNLFIEKLVQRSEGLPLYIHLVIQDIKSGKLSLTDEKSLPQGLNEYYKGLLERLMVGNTSVLLNHLFGIICWAYEPLTKDDLYEIIASTYEKEGFFGWENALENALQYGTYVLKLTENQDHQLGWTFYHHSFRNYLLESSEMSLPRSKGQQMLLEWCSKWDENQKTYPIKYYAKHLYKAYENNSNTEWKKRYENQLFDLSINTHFVQTTSASD